MNNSVNRISLPISVGKVPWKKFSSDPCIAKGNTKGERRSADADLSNGGGMVDKVDSQMCRILN